jgi:hypothetical protein
MTIKKEYIILISIIGLLTAYLLVQNKDRTHYELPEIRQIEKSDITKIKIKRSGSEIILSRENDAWVISSQNFPADSRAVENMLDAFAGLTLTALVSESRNYSRYELDEDRKIGVEAFTGDNSLQIIEVGKPASSHRNPLSQSNPDRVQEKDSPKWKTDGLRQTAENQRTAKSMT